MSATVGVTEYAAFVRQTKDPHCHHPCRCYSNHPAILWVDGHGVSIEIVIGRMIQKRETAAQV